ncbi:hypothetical protein [Brevundimonas diminuta]|uniref:hypothetical protein n=1 Tax=Brevundimonas diminuta TaxID=293 RepID=UPI0032097220
MTSILENQDWIVLPQLSNRQEWISALKAAATKAGRVLLDVDQDQSASAPPHALLLTASADNARKHQPDANRIAAILDTPNIDTPDGVEQSERHRIVHVATHGFAQITLLPKDRIFEAGSAGGLSIHPFPDLEVLRPPLPSAAQGPLATALQIYTQDKAIWSGEVLSWLKPPVHVAGSTSLDLTGRPRTIVHGPYFEMPAGRWKATFTLSVDHYSARYLFRIDWGGLESYSSQEFRPQRPGIYEIDMVYEWMSQGACEFRLLVMEGVFHGDISVSDIKVSRIENA